MTTTKRRISRDKKNAKKAERERRKYYGVVVVDHTIHRWSDSHEDGGSSGQETITKGIKKVKEGADIATTFDIDVEKKYYLVKVTYSTGDSFGSHSGNASYLDLFETRKPALELKQALEKHNPNLYKDYTQRFTLRCNRKDYYVMQYFGYFEHIESIDVEEVSVLL